MLIPRITHKKNGWFKFNAENHIKLPWSMVSIPCTWHKTWKNAGFSSLVFIPADPVAERSIFVVQPIALMGATEPRNHRK
jgi:hypothetical protein